MTGTARHEDSRITRSFAYQQKHQQRCCGQLEKNNKSTTTRQQEATRRGEEWVVHTRTRMERRVGKIRGESEWAA